MKSLNFSILSVLVLAAGLTAQAEDGWTFFDGRWRINGGAVFNSSVKSRLHFAPSNLRPNGSTAVPQAGSMTRDEAVASVIPDANGEYPNGAYFLPDGLGRGSETWCGYIPSIPSENFDASTRRITFYQGQYSEIESAYVGGTIAEGKGGDFDNMPGVTLELSRELYRNDEDHYGLDIAAGFIYYFGNNFLKTGYNYQAGAETLTEHAGSYDASIAAPDALDYSGWWWNGAVGGSYGHGRNATVLGGGPVFDMSTISVTGPNEQSNLLGSSPCYGAMRATGDYQQLEMLFTVRPYYDFTDWLRLYGTAGVAVSYDKIDLDVSMREDGYSYRHSSSHDEWDVYGVAGLGLMLRYDDYTLGVDVMARFLDDKIRFNDPYVNGYVERGNWFGRVTLGYQF